MCWVLHRLRGLICWAIVMVCLIVLWRRHYVFELSSRLHFSFLLSKWLGFNSHILSQANLLLNTFRRSWTLDVVKLFGCWVDPLNSSAHFGGTNLSDGWYLLHLLLLELLLNGLHGLWTLDLRSRDGLYDFPVGFSGTRLLVILAELTSGLLALCARLSFLKIPVGDLIAFLLLLIFSRLWGKILLIIIAAIFDYARLRVVLLQFHDEICFIISSPHESSRRSVSLIASRARPEIRSRSNGVENILPIFLHEQVLLHLHFSEFRHHFEVLLVNAQHFALPVAKVRVRDGAESSCMLFRRSNHLLCELGLGRVHRRRLVAMEYAWVVDEYIGSSVPDQVVDVLAVNLFIQDIDVMTLAILNFCNRFDKPLILLNPLSIAGKIKYSSKWDFDSISLTRSILFYFS